MRRSTPDLRAALELAAERIVAYHVKQKPEDSDYDRRGRRRGSARGGARSMRRGSTSPAAARPIPVSVLMNAIPAKVAGVERLVMVTPDARRRGQPAGARRRAHRRRRRDLADRRRAGGRGARLRHRPDRAGRCRMRPRQRLGRRGQAAAFGVVGIDMVAGPSEIVVVADGRNDPQWIAADLLSQAEHDPSSQSILFTDDAAFARAVADGGRSARSASCRPPRSRAQSWDANGAIIVTADLVEAMPLVDRLAPEHLELALRRCRSAVRPGQPCRVGVPRPPHARSGRRLRRRARTTSCPPAAARASRRGCRCSIS